MIHRREGLKLISMDIVLQMSSCNITCATGGVLHKCLKAVYREVASSCHVSKGCVVFSSPVIPRGTGLEYGESPLELVHLFSVVQLSYGCVCMKGCVKVVGVALEKVKWYEWNNVTRMLVPWERTVAPNHWWDLNSTWVFSSFT